MRPLAEPNRTDCGTDKASASQDFPQAFSQAFSHLSLINTARTLANGDAPARVRPEAEYRLQGRTSARFALVHCVGE